MPHVLRSTLVVLGILFGGWTDATPFTVELTVPSNSALPNVVYATVRGEVDPADNTVMHFSIELNPALSTLLHGGNNFGIAGFWFNSDLLLSPAQFKNVTPADTWAISASNPNCPGGCARGSGFGEFNMRLIWSGAPADRPEHLAFAIDFGSAVTEGNFNLLSVEKPPGSTNVGHFVLFLDGFDTTIGGVRIRSTFAKDVSCHIGSCDDNNACTEDVCDPKTGACTHPLVSCDDQNACTSDFCTAAGGCQYDLVSCDDGNECSTDSCHPQTGCAHGTVSCEDNNRCTVDSCTNEAGCSNQPVACGPLQACNPGTGDCEDVQICGQVRGVPGPSSSNGQFAVFFDTNLAFCQAQCDANANCQCVVWADVATICTLHSLDCNDFIDTSRQSLLFYERSCPH